MYLQSDTLQVVVRQVTCRTLPVRPHCVAPLVYILCHCRLSSSTLPVVSRVCPCESLALVENPHHYHVPVTEEHFSGRGREWMLRTRSQRLQGRALRPRVIHVIKIELVKRLSPLVPACSGVGGSGISRSIWSPASAAAGQRFLI